MTKIAFPQCYITGVWLLAIPPVLVCSLFGALAPHLMAAPPLAALMLTIPVIDDRPQYRPVLLLSLLLLQVGAAAATTALLRGRPTQWERNAGTALWVVAILLPYVIIAVALIGARNDNRLARAGAAPLHAGHR